MSAVEKRTTTTIRHEYIVPKPANWAEMGKAAAMAKRDMQAAGKDPQYDDAAWFDADDEHVILYWDEVATA